MARQTALTPLAPIGTFVFINETGTHQYGISSGVFHSETSGTAGVTGTLASTESADIAALAGNLSVFGSLAATETGDIASISGTVVNAFTLVAVETPDSLSIAGSVGDAPTGSLVTTEAQDIVSFAGQLNIFGPFATSEASDTVVFAGNVNALGSLVTTEGQDVVNFQGSATTDNTGTLDSTEAKDVALFVDFIAGGITRTHYTKVRERKPRLPPRQYVQVHPITLKEAAAHLAAAGGNARAKSLNQTQRTKIATVAAKARWK